MLKVNCICDGISFPHGEATNQRIIMIGKALMAKGDEYRVFVNCLRPRNILNKERKGRFGNIPFRHMNKSLVIGRPKWTDAIDYYFVGFYNTSKLIRSWRRDKQQVIYLYSQGSLFNAFVSFLAFVYKVSVVQEVNEWRDDLKRTSLKSFIYKSVMFRWAKGAVSISDNITAEINRYKLPRNNIYIIQVPILADKLEWPENTQVTEKTFVWCGQVDGYHKDVILIMKAFAEFNNQIPDYRLIVCGKYKTSTSIIIQEAMNNLKLDKNLVEFTGFVSDVQLREYCQKATALISPLWHDQQSLARFPTKIASYLFAARPVLTCGVGETGKYLKDLENALFFEPGDESGLCRLMERCALDQPLANQIGKAGYHLASGAFDFRRHSEKLNNLFELAIT